MTFYGNRLVFSDGVGDQRAEGRGCPRRDGQRPVDLAAVRLRHQAGGHPGHRRQGRDRGLPERRIARERRLGGLLQRRRGRHPAGLPQRLRPARERERAQRRLVARRVADRLARRPGPEGRRRAGAPAGRTATPCSFTSPPVLISGVAAKNSADLKNDVYLTTVGPSFGGADVGAILAARQAPAAAPPAAPPPAPARGRRRSEDHARRTARRRRRSPRASASRSCPSRPGASTASRRSPRPSRAA